MFEDIHLDWARPLHANRDLPTEIEVIIQERHVSTSPRSSNSNIRPRLGIHAGPYVRGDLPFCGYRTEINSIANPNAALSADRCTHGNGTQGKVDARAPVNSFGYGVGLTPGCARILIEIVDRAAKHGH